jgi:hypothetical protein
VAGILEREISFLPNLFQSSRPFVVSYTILEGTYVASCPLLIVLINGFRDCRIEYEINACKPVVREDHK